MNKKLKNSIKSGILIFAIILFFTNCEANKDIIEESELEHHTPPVLSEKISFTHSKHFNEINSEIKSIQTKFNKKQTSKENQSEIGSLKILTDEVLYVTYAGTHTYTFKVVRKNPIYLLENIVLHYNLRTKSYDEYLMQYKDLKEQDIKGISEGKLFQDSKKVIVTKLENGFFESHSSSNKGGSSSKASNFICNTVTSTLVVSCSREVHNAGNMEEWHKCEAEVKPYAYQASVTTCVPTYTSTPIPQETANPSSSGGGNDPYVVVYNPLPLETCDNSDEVDLNGNCIQPIDIAVSYIANCLSSHYSTILTQSEINFLYSTTSSFEIKSYLENNGRSSENISFVKEMINRMRQSTDVFTSITPFLIEKQINDNQLNPCEKGVFTTVKNTTVCDIAQVLAKLDANKSVYNTIIKSEVPSNGNPATTFPTSRFNYTIQISTDYEGKTKLFIANSLIHELVHAYFLSIVDDYKSNPNNNQNLYNLNSFPSLFQAYCDKKYPPARGMSENLHHLEMANYYVDAIARALQEFQTGIPVAEGTSPQQIYSDLAWGGLNGTPVFDATYPIGNPNRQRIINRAVCEQNGTTIGAGTPNAQTPIGNPCN